MRTQIQTTMFNAISTESNQLKHSSGNPSSGNPSSGNPSSAKSASNKKVNSLKCVQDSKAKQKPSKPGFANFDFAGVAG